MLTYLACPIDAYKKDGYYEASRSGLKKHLVECGATVFEPIGGWSLDPVQTSVNDWVGISEVNFVALDQSDLIVAMAPPGIPSVGVPIEVYHTLVTRTNARVALWFGAPDPENPRSIGSVWHYLIHMFSPRIYLLPAPCQLADVRGMFKWVRQDVAF